MASLKETPRQKMIGMMYLVLTALLALQVSDALLEKFALLNSSLELANQSALNKSKGMVEGIEQRVKDLPKPEAYSNVITDAKEVRRITDELVSQIENIKGKVIESGGGIDPETKNIKNPKEEEGIFNLMVGANKNGEAYKLIPKFSKYLKDLEKISDPGTKFSSLVMTGSENPLAQHNPNLSKLDFAELNFAHTPVAAALATLSQFQAEIRRDEAEVLNQLAGKVGAKEIKFDKVFAQVSAESNTVVAGTEYNAEVFIAATSSGFSPRMSINGSSLKVIDGRGKINFKAVGGDFGSSDRVKKTYVASVTYMSPTGPKTETITKEYFVLKPTYMIASTSMPPLYFGCSNQLNFTSAGLGALWNPVFDAKGATLVKGLGGKVTIIPSSNKVALKVMNGGVVLGYETFKVSPVPKPEIKFFVNGSEIDIKRGYSFSNARKIDVKAFPDPSFTPSNPLDARYSVTKYTVSLARGTRRVAFLDFSGSGSISPLVNQAQPGDRYIIEAKEVTRTNSEGNPDKIAINASATCPLN